MLENTRKYAVERAAVESYARTTRRRCAETLAKLRRRSGDETRRRLRERSSVGRQHGCFEHDRAGRHEVARCWGRTWPASSTARCSRCLEAADFVVFSGLKTDKLDDLEAMIDRGRGSWVFTSPATSLAIVAEEGRCRVGRPAVQLGLGRRSGERRSKPYFISRAAVSTRRGGCSSTGRARRGSASCMPVDFVLGDGTDGRRARPGRSTVRRRREDVAIFRREDRRVYRRCISTSTRETADRRCCSTTACSACSKIREVRKRHEELHAATEAAEGRRGRGVHRRRRRGGGHGKVRPARLGSRTASRPAARCSTRWAARRCRTCKRSTWRPRRSKPEPKGRFAIGSPIKGCVCTSGTPSADRELQFRRLNAQASAEFHKAVEAAPPMASPCA
jgi:hypothetical protein